MFWHEQMLPYCMWLLLNTGLQVPVQLQGQNREWLIVTQHENSKEFNLWAWLKKCNTFPSNTENLREYSYLEMGHSDHWDRGSKCKKREITVITEHFNREKIKYTIKPWRALFVVPIRKKEATQWCLMVHIWLWKFLLPESLPSTVNYLQDPYFFISSLTEPLWKTWIGHKMLAHKKILERVIDYCL